MKHIQRLLALILSLTMLGGCTALAQGAPSVYRLGDQIEDFTFTTWDGQTMTLSSLLNEKDMVLINLWATWCGPCRNEFPFMEAAYKQYSDDVAIVALSVEPNDTPQKLGSFVSQMGMTFHVGQDTANLAYRFNASAIPTTIVVDRYGVICFRMEGSFPDASSFTRLFDAFVGEDYAQSRLLTALPPARPSAAPADPADLAAALGTPNAANPTDRYTWPMAVAEQDGRTVVTSTNRGSASSTAAVETTVVARTGDAIAVTFRTSTEALGDLMTISVDGKPVKVFGGTHDWMTWAYPVPADGEYVLTLSYAKNAALDGGLDAIWVDSVAVLSGADATAALAANPTHPTAEANTLTVITPSAREIIFADEFGILANAFGPARYYIVNADEVTFAATITADVDPEAAFFYSYYDNAITPLSKVQNGDGYLVSTGVDSMATTGYTYCYLQLVPDVNGSDFEVAVFLRDEANVRAFVQNNGLGAWKYADAAGQVSYTLRYVNQHGDPVPGVMVQVCDEHTCQVYTTDANGTVTFTAAPYAWEIHTLKLPAGYTGDTESVTLAPTGGGEMVFTVTME